MREHAVSLEVRVDADQSCVGRRPITLYLPAALWLRRLYPELLCVCLPFLAGRQLPGSPRCLRFLNVLEDGDGHCLPFALGGSTVLAGGQVPTQTLARGVTALST